MAVDPNIKQKADRIRTEIYGQDVRESLASGIEEMSEDVVDNTGRQDAVEEQFQEVIENTTEKDVISAPEIIAARNGKNNLKQRLDSEHQEVTAQLAQTETKADENKRAVDYYWKPETQRPARLPIINDPFIDIYEATHEDIYAFYDDYAENNGAYFDKIVLGNDTSGQYPINLYRHRPKNPKKTMAIVSNLHGSEKLPVATMIRFFHYLLNEAHKYPLLAQIKEEVQILYIPVANPWGFNNNTRHNSNGVDLNRNFGYKWDGYTGTEAFGQNYKGTAPFSEKETQYIKQVVEEYQADVFIDLHNTGQSDNYDFYVAVPDNYRYSTYDKLLQVFAKHVPADRISYQKGTDSNYPSSSNYFYNVQNVVASTPEWCDKSFGEVPFDSMEITKSLEWFANIIIEHNREFTGRNQNIVEKRFSYGQTDILIDEDVTKEIGQLKNTIPSKFHGIAVYEGYVTVGLMSGSGNLTVIPLLGQAGNGEGLTYNDPRTSEWSNYISIPPDMRMSVPFRASIPIKPTVPDSVVQVGCGLAARASGDSSYRIYRFHAHLTLIPTDSSHDKQIY